MVNPEIHPESIIVSNENNNKNFKSIIFHCFITFKKIMHCHLFFSHMLLLSWVFVVVFIRQWLLFCFVDFIFLCFAFVSMFTFGSPKILYVLAYNQVFWLCQFKYFYSVLHPPSLLLPFFLLPENLWWWPKPIPCFRSWLFIRTEIRTWIFWFWDNCSNYLNCFALCFCSLRFGLVVTNVCCFIYFS